MEFTKHNKRVKWLDYAKAVAIIAVIVDHTYGILYTSDLFLGASFFSVGLFVLVSGISVNNGKKKTFSYQLRKAGKLLLQYACATGIVLVCTNGFFDVKTYITQLLNFSIVPPYYYVLFFTQLVISAPVLISWCKLCETGGKKRIIFHFATVIMLCLLASIFIRCTYVLDVHGGGMYLFGGTYIILYYIGILLSELDVFEITKWSKGIRIFTCVITFIIMITLVWARFKDVLYIDKILEPYWGIGINPPSVQAMLLTISVLFGCYSFFTIWEEVHVRVISLLLNILEIIGQNTIYIFLYHWLVKDMIMNIVPSGINVCILRLILWPAMLLIPMIGASIAKKCLNGIKKIYSMY